MPKSHRLAVIIANENQQNGPSVQDCTRFVETGQDSIPV
jgi:hypothetical protein